MTNQNKKIILLILIGLFFLAGWFYWFQYRPSVIREKCVNEAIWKARKMNDWLETYTSKHYDFYYTQCLNKNGLK